MEHEKVVVSKDHTYELQHFFEQNWSHTMGMFNGKFVKIPQYLFHQFNEELINLTITFRVVSLKDDKDNKNVRELIEEFYAITEQMPNIFAHLCLAAKVDKTPIAFIAFDIKRLNYNLQKLKRLDFSKSLTGAEVKDYVNLVNYPNEAPDCLLDFKLDAQIPSKVPDDEAIAVFYFGKNSYVKINFKRFLFLIFIFSND